jgi:hypothetical protein
MMARLRLTSFMNVGTEEGSNGTSVLEDLKGLLPEVALWQAESSTSPFQRTSLGGRRAARLWLRPFLG